MAPDSHKTSGSVSSDGSTVGLLPESNSCLSLPAQTYIRDDPSFLPDSTFLFHEECVQNLQFDSVSSSMLFGDGYTIIRPVDTPHCGDSNRECSIRSSHNHLETCDTCEEPVPRSDISTSSGSSRYCIVEEQIYTRLHQKITGIPKPRKVPILLCFSVSVGLLAFSLVAIVAGQYIKSSGNLYEYENCKLCSELTKDEREFITYLRRRGDLKYCCFESLRDPVYNLKKATKKAFAPMFKAEELRWNKSIEVNGTDAAMELTVEIGEISSYFIPTERELPMRKLKPVSSETKIEKDKLVIQTPGRYFIQSQFYHNIKHMKQIGADRLKNVIGHDIQRANWNLPNDGREQLAVSFYTAQVYYPVTDHHVSCIAGIFRLNKNDKIFVGVSHRNETQYSYISKNRLSLILLGN